MIGISVVIACLNGAETLGEALDSLALQRYDEGWEIVLADNGSTDDTRDVFAAFAARRPDLVLRIVDASDRPGKTHALNAGIRAARGDRLLFLDADDTVAPGWLAAMAAALARHDFVAARFDLEALNQPWVLETRTDAQVTGLWRLRHAPHCAHAGGATLGFHRHVFEAVGGFDPEFVALEDIDFCVRASLAGFELTFAPAAAYNCRYRAEPAAIRRQAHGWGRYMALLRRRYDPAATRYAPLPWLSLGLEFARLGVWRAARGARPLTELEACRFNRRLGAALGDLDGARAYGVAPERRSLGGATLRRLWRRSQEALLRPLRPWFGSTLSVRTSEKLVALTFDDGPDPASTPALLDLLARTGAKATFFVIGSRAARHPDLIARMLAEGHEIGNHSWDHPSLTHVPPAQTEAQLRRTQALLAPHGQTLMRPPYGDQDLRINRIARRLGYRVVLWNVSGADWEDDDAETLTARLLAGIAPGAIVLLHDSLYSCERETFRDRAPTIDAVAQVIARLPDYRFATVSELLAQGVGVEEVARKSSPADYLARLIFPHRAHAPGAEAAQATPRPAPQAAAFPDRLPV